MYSIYIFIDKSNFHFNLFIHRTQALTELRILNCCRIDNILPLYAVSLDGPEPCLVYQYMSNGSLEDRLLCKGNTVPLTWIQRAKIGEGVARALNFLHTLKGNPFVHGDVKSANILLDPMFEPKLGDFGLARQVVKNSRNENSIYTHCTVSSVNGTSVYLPAEYLRQKILSPAVDVYSYGIVILEMATGRRAYDGKKLLINSVEDEYSKVQNATLQIQSIKSDNNNNQNQKQDSTNENTLEFLMDKRIVNLTDNRHLFNYLLELGRRCAHKTKSKRGEEFENRLHIAMPQPRDDKVNFKNDSCSILCLCVVYSKDENRSNSELIMLNLANLNYTFEKLKLSFFSIF